MRLLKFLAIAGLAVGLSACAGQWGNAEVTPATGASAAPAVAPTDPATIILTEEDITNRSYKVLADLEVTANKTTLFNKDPTNEDIDRRLRDEAAKLGADAVILVRYGTVGVSLFSWGSLDGQGRAVKFTY